MATLRPLRLDRWHAEMLLLRLEWLTTYERAHQARTYQDPADG